MTSTSNNVLQMPELDAELSSEIKELWDSVVGVCNKTLKHSQVYGFYLMGIPDPDVTKIIQAIELQATPILEALISKGYLKVEDELNLINIKQYLSHLRDVVLALKSGDRDDFDKAVEKLSKEAMLLSE